MAAAYSPTLVRSTIGGAGLNCSVRSAVPDLTALFGMGRGGTPALKLPEIS